MPEFKISVKYTSIGDVRIEADTYDEAVSKAITKLNTMRMMGSIPTDREVISWSGDELEIAGEEVSEDAGLDD